MPPRSKRRSRGLSRHRAAWARALGTQFTVYHYPLAELQAERDASPIPGENDDGEVEENDWQPGPDDAAVYLALETTGGGRISLPLAVYTFEELLALKSVIDIAFNLAAPAVRARDERAANDIREGRFTNSRFYRSLPEFIVRARVLGGYGQGVQVGPDDALAGNIMPEHITEQLREHDALVVEHQREEEPEAEDDRTPPDERSQVL